MVEVIEEPVKATGFQEYVAAPAAVNVVVSLEQSVVEEADKVKTGIEFMVKLTVAVFEQPFPVKPFKVYTVVEVGLTVTVLTIKLPGFHVYPDAPDPDKTIEPPSQIEFDDEEIVKVGTVVF